MLIIFKLTQAYIVKLFMAITVNFALLADNVFTRIAIFFVIARISTTIYASAWRCLQLISVVSFQIEINGNQFEQTSTKSVNALFCQTP